MMLSLVLQQPAHKTTQQLRQDKRCASVQTEEQNTDGLGWTTRWAGLLFFSYQNVKIVTHTWFDLHLYTLAQYSDRPNRNTWIKVHMIIRRSRHQTDCAVHCRASVRLDFWGRYQQPRTSKDQLQYIDRIFPPPKPFLSFFLMNCDQQANWGLHFVALTWPCLTFHTAFEMLKTTRQQQAKFHIKTANQFSSPMLCFLCGKNMTRFTSFQWNNM